MCFLVTCNEAGWLDIVVFPAHIGNNTYRTEYGVKLTPNESVLEIRRLPVTCVKLGILFGIIQLLSIEESVECQRNCTGNKLNHLIWSYFGVGVLGDVPNVSPKFAYRKSPIPLMCQRSLRVKADNAGREASSEIISSSRNVESASWAPINRAIVNPSTLSHILAALVPNLRGSIHRHTHDLGKRIKYLISNQVSSPSQPNSQVLRLTNSF